jgi:hypothetical protein
VRENDVLYPYSSVFLAGLPETGEARALPRAQVQSLLAALDRVDYPSGDVFVAVPAGTARRFERPPPLFGGQDFGSWVILRERGPFADREEVLRAIDRALGQGRGQLRTPLPEPLVGWFELNRTVICESLSKLGSQCGTE